MTNRKTVDVEYVKMYGNDMLRESPDASVDHRVGIQTMVEQVLMETGNYRGYRYLTMEDFKGTENKRPGINIEFIDSDIVGDPRRFENCDS